MDAKTIAIIAHIPGIGWIIGWILNMKEKDEFAAFYNRQQTGIHILWFICAILPLIGWILGIGVLVLWVLSLIGAVEGEKKPTPFFGPYFQRWL